MDTLIGDLASEGVTEGMLRSGARRDRIVTPQPAISKPSEGSHYGETSQWPRFRSRPKPRQCPRSTRSNGATPWRRRARCAPIQLVSGKRVVLGSGALVLQDNVRLQTRQVEPTARALDSGFPRQSFIEAYQ